MVRVSRNQHIVFFVSIIISMVLSGADHQALCNRPNYKKLASLFGQQQLLATLHNYQNNNYASDNDFKVWSGIADKVIGIKDDNVTVRFKIVGINDDVEGRKHYFLINDDVEDQRRYLLLNDDVEDQRRYFLISARLHLKNYREGLQTLVACFNDSDTKNSAHNTPHGPIYNQLHHDEYKNAMKVSAEIRNTMFGKGKNKANPLVLVKKIDSRMNIAMKWALFKAAAIITSIISSASKKKEKEDKKDIDKTLASTLHIADLVQAIEEYAKNDLEKQYPILKTHEVKSLIGEKTWWLYDRKNWITMGSAGCMAFLLLAVLYDKIPYISHCYHSWHYHYHY